MEKKIQVRNYDGEWTKDVIMGDITENVFLIENGRKIRYGKNILSDYRLFKSDEGITWKSI